MCNSLVIVTVLFRLVSRRNKSRHGTDTEGESVPNDGDNRDYNSGERAIGLSVQNRHRSRDHRHTARISTVSESQLTDIGEMQTISYSLGSLLDRRGSEGLDLGNDDASSKLEQDDEEKRKS